MALNLHYPSLSKRHSITFKTNFIKTLIFYLSFFLTASIAFSQDDVMTYSTGLPGDQFSLEGAIELFKKADSPEAFEKIINDQNSGVHNLDLNEDGDIDYIKVVSKQDGDVHLFILQVSVSESENQDIAVIGLEKTKENEAILQITGDEDIYGEEIIVEPSDGDEEYDVDINKKGPSPYYPNKPVLVVNVWTWPCVRFVYAPSYRPWVSPWRWRSYPGWWKPWRPLRWSAWHPVSNKHYGPTVRVAHTHRTVKAHKAYRPLRVTSTTVRTRHSAAHANYKVTRTKTKVTGPRGNSVTKKNTTVKGPRGNVKKQKTTIKKSRKN